jgi:hypothetical protein
MKRGNEAFPSASRASREVSLKSALFGQRCHPTSAVREVGVCCQERTDSAKELGKQCNDGKPAQRRCFFLPLPSRYAGEAILKESFDFYLRHARKEGKKGKR